jgi:hypothetical protein
MHARLISFSVEDADKRDAVAERVRETVIPMLRQYDGYAGYLALFDGENRRARAAILWESGEAADAAEEELVERRQRLAGEVGMTVESADLYEVLALDLERATAKVS